MPVKSELDILADQGVLHKLRPDQCSDWVSMPVYVKKPNGSLWLYLDPRPLNKYLVCPVQNTDNTLKDMLPQFVRARYFIILDAKSRFWQLELGKESQSLTTMTTMFDHYHWQKLPFGLSCGFDLFSTKLQELYQGVANCLNNADDVVMYGFNEDGLGHDQTLVAVLWITQANNLKFNPDKYILCATQVSFFGHLVSSQGFKLDPNKINVLRTSPQPRWANYKVSCALWITCQDLIQGWA